jgi:hypothetical protein
MSRPLVAALEKLLNFPGDEVPASTFTSAQRRALEDWARKTVAVRVKPQGAGYVYQVADSQLVRRHLTALRPHSSQELADGVPQRAANIGRGRSSKGRAHGHDTYYLLMKAIGADVIWRHRDGRLLDLSQTTAIAGAGTLAVRADDAWQTEMPLWLVENQALFDRLDWMPPEAHGSIAYYAGQLDGRLLKWLADRPRTPNIVFFPDYDGVGLLNFAKLLEISRSPCAFWLIPRWRALLERYGSNRIWRDTLSDFKAAVLRLNAVGVSSELLELCAILSKKGLALEHETVWLSDS